VGLGERQSRSPDAQAFAACGGYPGQIHNWTYNTPITRVMLASRKWPRLVVPAAPPGARQYNLTTDDRAWSWPRTPGCHNRGNVAPSVLRLVAVAV
jgi:hypothetical protein